MKQGTMFDSPLINRVFLVHPHQRLLRHAAYELKLSAGATRFISDTRHVHGLSSIPNQLIIAIDTDISHIAMNYGPNDREFLAFFEEYTRSRCIPVLRYQLS